MAKQSGTLKRKTNSRLKNKKCTAQRLIEDHKKLKVLYAELGKSKNLKRKQEIFETIAEEMKFDQTSEREFLSLEARIGTVGAELPKGRIPFVDETWANTAYFFKKLKKQKGSTAQEVPRDQ